MNRLLHTSPLHTDLATLLLRLMFGGLFIYFGYTKLSNYDQILPMFGDVIGIGSQLSLNLVIFAELGCGILVTLGVLTRLSIIPIFITMTVAYFVAHANDPFQNKLPSFIFWCLSFPIFILGSGKYSIDHFIKTFRK